MNDRQCRILEGTTLPAGAIGSVRALVDAIEQSGINIDCTAANGFAPWPFEEGDIDTEILEWIVSHAASRRRSNAC
ncbi:MAG: hypothetical protein JO228_15190, partial [Xanthobacteraceae bacterium]|nr:hypothetical protein [Xanthobacteraceae bacterium]